MLKQVLKTFVAVLAIAAAATGPARAQSNPTKYTSAVAMSALQVGDTLAEGFSLTSNESNFIYLVANRHKHNENLSGFPENITLDQIQSIGANCVFSTLVNEQSITFAPVDENGQDCDAWVVTEVESIEGFTNITIAGIRIPGPLYTVRLAAGTEDAANWSIAPEEALTTGIVAGSTLTTTYDGDLKVKSVKAVKYVAPAATVTTAPTATAAIIEAGSTTALVNAGAANGGTMMYAVTTTNAQPASTADFSATRPTAEGRAAGTYYVWYYAKADADHSDSEIAGPVPVTVAVMYTLTWNSSNISDLEVMGTSTSYMKEGITLSANANMNDAEWYNNGDESMSGIEFHVNQSGGYTFTAPTGKKFIKIEMTPNSPGGWDFASLGTGWAYSGNPMTNIYKVTWTGSAASTVGLLTGANMFMGEPVKSIVFTLIDAQ